jgi:cation diffusion facilitator CzcD-associated flavoprotein CzcO
MQAPVDVLIIGAGFGGVGAGIALARAGRRDFVIVEQDEGVGGTWWANRYPGAACDIPSLLYSFSFAPKRDWSRHYPAQAEIADYLADCVARFGLQPHLRLSTRVTSLAWDEAVQRWQVAAQGADGASLQWSARVVVSASGGLSQPKLPALPGLDSFAGPRCHTARWNDAIGTPGQRVGIVGTGASAIQLAPQLAARGAQLSVFQRTPPWLLPKRDHAIGRVARWLRRHVPGWQRAARALIYAQHELRAPGFTRHPRLLRAAEPVALAYLRRKVPAGALRDALTPNYRMGCKRILLADDFFPALQQPNVHLVTQDIARVEPDGVRTADGELHRLDALVLATGFDAADGVLPFQVRGRSGADLNAQWRDHGAQAYLGSGLPGFPNLFLIVGPNTGLGHNSMVFMIESQLRHLLAALSELDRRRAAALEVRPAAFARFNDELQGRLSRTVWATGCRSWYQARDGRITALWPGTTLEFRRRTRHLRAADYRFT